MDQCNNLCKADAWEGSREGGWLSSYYASSAAKAERMAFGEKKLLQKMFQATSNLLGASGSECPEVSASPDRIPAPRCDTPQVGTSRPLHFQGTEA